VSQTRFPNDTYLGTEGVVVFFLSFSGSVFVSQTRFPNDTYLGTEGVVVFFLSFNSTDSMDHRGMGRQHVDCTRHKQRIPCK
jgi:hypothetical protein